MKESTGEPRNGLQGTSWIQLDDVDFADDLVLLLHDKQQMQEKTDAVATI